MQLAAAQGLVRAEITLSSATKSTGDDKRGFYGVKASPHPGARNPVSSKPGNTFP
jgi:hypothetical protein